MARLRAHLKFMAAALKLEETVVLQYHCFLDAGALPVTTNKSRYITNIMLCSGFY
jgi:hypothetical protein